MSLTQEELILSLMPAQLPENRSGWNYPADTQSAMTAYRATGDSAWIDVSEKYVDLILDSTDEKIGIIDALGNSEHQWSTSGYSNDGEFFPNEVSFGTYSAAIAEHVLLTIDAGREVNQDHVAGMYKAAQGAMNLLKNSGQFEALAYWDVRYNQFRKTNYKTNWLPLNMQSHLCLGLLLTYKVLEKLGDDRYLEVKNKYHKLATYISRKMTRTSQLSWKYWNDHRVEDWGHSGATVRFIAYDWIYGTVFSFGDITKLYNIIHFHTKPDDYMHPLRVDGTPFTESNERYYERYFSAYFHWKSALIVLGLGNDNIDIGVQRLEQIAPTPRNKTMSFLVQNN